MVYADWTKCTAPDNNVRVLEVHTAMSYGDWKTLTDALRSSKSIRSLTFANGPMGLECAQLLSNVLLVNKRLTSLTVKGTKQTVQSVKLLLEAISQAAQSNAISEAMNAALEGVPPSAKPCGIQVLDLSDNLIGDEGVVSIAPLLKRTHISTLLLDGVGLTTEGFKRLILELPKGIQGTTVRSQKIITKIPFALEKLSMSFNAPGLEGVKALSDFLSLNTTITSLCLKNCQLGDTSVGFLAKSLGSTSLSRLSNLDLSFNQIGGPGAENLTSLLSANHLLVEVNIENNPVPDDKKAEIQRLTAYNQKLVDSRQVAPWKSDATIVILNDDGTTVGVTCTTVLSNGLVFIGSSYGDVYVWNPNVEETNSSRSVVSVRASAIAADPSFSKQGRIETKIVTYEPESRPTKRRINALIDNQDGTLWCVSDERSITIINIQDRIVQRRLPLHKYQAIAIAKFGTDVYLGGATGEVSLWRSDSLICRHEIVLDGRYPISAIHCDGEFVYVGVLVHPARAGHVLVFSQTMELVLHFEAHSEFISSIVTYTHTLKSDSRSAPAPATDATSSAGDEAEAKAESSEPTSPEKPAEAAPATETRIITSSWDKKIKVWTIDRSNFTAKLLHSLDGHHEKVTSLVLSNGNAISCSDDNTLIIWDISSSDTPSMQKRMLGAWGGSIYSLFAAHSKLVSCSHKEGRVTLWSLN